MFLRLLFVLLCALNIAVGAWLVLGQPYARSHPASDPGVPALRLLSEMPEPASTVPVAAVPALPTPANRSYSCLALGPFATP